MSNLTTQDSQITQLILALASRRTSPTYSTSYYWNSRILIVSNSLLANSSASLRTLLSRILNNATWFQSHYQSGLGALQRAQAAEASPQRRREMAADFEGVRGACDVWAPMMAAQAERLEVELRALRLLRVGPETSLRSHPVAIVESEQWRGIVPECRLTAPEDLALQLEVEMERKERVRSGKGTVVEGVDEDMLIRFWEANPEVGGLEGRWP